MKFLKFGSVLAVFALAACNTMNTPVSSTSFDPLGTPGSGYKADNTNYGPELSPGQFVTANIPNTAFYKNKPGANQDADKLLSQGTNMKIVALDSNYVKVELDSGEVGFVPAVMVGAADTLNTPEVVSLDGAYQVYPPLPDSGLIEPLPVIDPAGLPPTDAIPTIIDPTAPIPDATAPTLDSIPKIEADLPEKELDPVAEAVRQKVEAAKAEEEAKAAEALKETPAKAE